MTWGRLEANWVSISERFALEIEDATDWGYSLFLESMLSFFVE